MLKQVTTGGWTRGEREAWAAARRAGVATGGYMARGFATEEGPAAREGMLHGAVEFPMDESRRAGANLRRSDALLWLGDPLSDRGRATIAVARELGKPHLVAHPAFASPEEIASWLSVFDVGVLTVATDAAAHDPGLGALVGRFFDRIFRILANRDSR